MEEIKRYGNIIIIACIILEMLIWPSINNFFGCLMTAISWFIFSKLGLKKQVIREHTFAWLVFLSMSLYRILPLIVTMIEGNSIGYNFVLPLSTYCGETLLFLISAISFNLAIKCKKTLLSLKKILFHCDFYDLPNHKILWILGIVGFVLKIYVTVNHIQNGDVIGKMMVGFTFFQFAPILLFFPILLGDNRCNKIVIFNKSCFLYTILLVVFSFATNSRESLLEPIGTFVLLLLLSYINSSSYTCRIFNKKNIIIGIIMFVFLIPIFSDISLAMIYNRQFRTNSNRTEILIRTIETLRDKEKLAELRLLKNKKDFKEEQNESSRTWSETYVSNFALNRYCNLKITDNTLYHAKKVGFPNDVMYDNFWYEIFILLPTPISNFLGLKYDKNEYYSSGDRLRALSFNRHPHRSQLITSNLADGLLTFGYWYFPIEFLLFFVRFLFLDTFLLRYKGNVQYSVFGLIIIFNFIAMGVQAGGCSDSLQYLLRGYWQDVILFIIAITFIKKIAVRI